MPVRKNQPDFRTIERLMAQLKRPATGERPLRYREDDFVERGYDGSWVRGLFLRVNQQHSTWCLDYFSGGQRREYKLCDASLAVEQMWKEAVRKRGEIDTGSDPQGARQAIRATPTMRELIKLYKQERMPPLKPGEKPQPGTLRPNTRSSYTTSINLYIMPEFGSTKLGEFTQESGRKRAQKWHDNIAARGGHKRSGRYGWEESGGPAPYAAARAAEVLKVLGAFAVEKKFIRINPFEGIIRTPTKERENMLDEEQIASALKALYEEMKLPEFIDHPRGGKQRRRADNPGKGKDGWRRVRSARAFFIILFQGRRKMEVLKSMWDQFTDLNAKRVWWNLPTHDEYGEKTIKRGGKVELIPQVVELLLVMRAEADVTDEARADKGLPPQPYLFPAWRSQGRVPHQTNINHAWWRICEKAGIPHNKNTTTEAVVVHDLRHTCASMIDRMGGGQTSIKDVLLQKSLRSSDRYTHAFKEKVRADHNRAANAMLELARPIACARPTVATLADEEIAKRDEEIAELKARLALLEGTAAAD